MELTPEESVSDAHDPAPSPLTGPGDDAGPEPPERPTGGGPDASGPNRPTFFGPWGTRLALVFLLITALGIRVWHVDEPPLEFHPYRQYRSALMARSFATQSREQAADADRALAQATLERNRPLEPPLLEHLAARAWNERGVEELWIPRSISIVAWLIAGLALFALARRLTNADGALVTVAVFWFLPFGVPASRSFQPDPTMLALVSLSILFQWTHANRGGAGRLLLAALFAAGALFVKPVAVFPVFGAWIALRWSTVGFRSLLTGGASWLFAVIALGPTAAYYINGIFFSGFLGSQADESFQPNLILSESFWLGWLRMIDNVTGRVLPFVALLSVALLRSVRARALGLGLWLGYLAFGLVFTHHIHTHNYYSLVTVLISALSLSALGAAALGAVAASEVSPARRLAVVALLLGALGWTLYESPWRTQRRDTGLEIAVFDAIREHAENATNTVVLARDQGKPLQFHARFSASAWPYASTREALQRAGAPPIDIATKLVELGNPSHFVVADRGQLNAQPDLAAFLATRREIASDRFYAIYALAVPAEAEDEAAPGGEPLPAAETSEPPAPASDPTGSDAPQPTDSAPDAPAPETAETAETATLPPATDPKDS